MEIEHDDMIWSTIVTLVIFLKAPCRGSLLYFAIAQRAFRTALSMAVSENASQTFCESPWRFSVLTSERAKFGDLKLAGVGLPLS